MAVPLHSYWAGHCGGPGLDVVGEGVETPLSTLLRRGAEQAPGAKATESDALDLNLGPYTY